ncbi:MAG: hypothetical protein U0T84_07070 [Chitinophagales bacterium]
MKKFMYFTCALMLIISSCKKTETVTPTAVDLSGTTWNGTANVPGLSLSNKPFVLTFNADGTLVGSFTNGTSFALNGSWNLTPNSTVVHLFFTLASVSGSYVGQATLTTNNTKMESGVATNATSPTTNLNFTVAR